MKLTQQHPSAERHRERRCCSSAIQLNGHDRGAAIPNVLSIRWSTIKSSVHIHTVHFEVCSILCTIHNLNLRELESIIVSYSSSAAAGTATNEQRPVQQSYLLSQKWNRRAMDGGYSLHRPVDGAKQEVSSGGRGRSAVAELRIDSHTSLNWGLWYRCSSFAPRLSLDLASIDAIEDDGRRPGSGKVPNSMLMSIR